MCHGFGVSSNFFFHECFALTVRFKDHLGYLGVVVDYSVGRSTCFIVLTCSEFLFKSYSIKLQLIVLNYQLKSERLAAIIQSN